MIVGKIEQLVYSTSFLYDHFKEELAVLGGVFRCEVCGHEIGLEDIDIAQSLSTGWPRHCDTGMRWFTQRELDQS